MVADILTVIQSRMSKFSKGQKLIAKYILSAYDKAALMTASKLGGVVQVSESTVVPIFEADTVSWNAVMILATSRLVER